MHCYSWRVSHLVVFVWDIFRGKLHRIFIYIRHAFIYLTVVSFKYSFAQSPRLILWQRQWLRLPLKYSLYSLWTVTVAMKLKDACSLEEKL